MITFIPTPIGNPQDITIRAIKYFEKTTLFLCEDTRETKRLLRLLEDRFEMSYPKADFISFNQHNGFDRLKELKDRLENEENIVYVSDAGMPIISDPGQILVEYAQENNIDYDVLAGASAVTTAYASSGFEDGKFLFWAFLPHKGKERERELNKALNCGYNAVLYEAPHRLAKLIDEIEKADDSREIFLAKELTKKYQKYYRGNIKDIKKEFETINIRGEWVVIIKAKEDENQTLNINDILSMDIPPKIKAKLLAQVSNSSVKEWYNKLITSK